MNITLTAIEYESPEGVTCPELRNQLRKRVGYLPVCVMVNAIDYMTTNREGTEVNMRSGDSFIVIESIEEINEKLYASTLYPFN
jgi:hypothetical protein